MNLRILLLLTATLLITSFTGCPDGPQNEQVVIPPENPNLDDTRPVHPGSDTRAGEEIENKVAN